MESLGICRYEQRLHFMTSLLVTDQLYCHVAEGRLLELVLSFVVIWTQGKTTCLHLTYQC